MPQIETMAVEVRLLDAHDAHVLDNVAPDVFDHAIDAQWSAKFFAEPCHHLAVALDRGQVVGMASAVVHSHPDKAPQMFINEVGVAPSHARQGIGRAVVAAILDRARSLGCIEAWVATENDNYAAQRLYVSAGAREPEAVLMYTFDLRPEHPFAVELSTPTA